MLLVPLAGSCILSPISRSKSDFQTDSERKIISALLDIVGLHGGASHTALLQACEMSRSTFNYALNALVRKGEVVNTGSKSRSFYVPGGGILPDA